MFEPLLAPARYKGAHGGRGSGKSHFFAELLVEECYRRPGTRAVCIREVQKTLAQSSKHLIESKIEALGLSAHFGITKEAIKTPGDGEIIFVGMQDHNAESIKSMEGMRYAWVEEAQTLSARSLSLLRPTIRLPGSELWFSWNPTRKSDAVHALLCGDTIPANAVVVKANYADNPWFPEVLEQERIFDSVNRADQYEHIWLGEVARAFSGSYFADGLAKAREEGRIGRVAADPLLPIKLFWDLGGAGANADALSIWACQFVGQEIRVLRYLETRGQVLAYVVEELRKHKLDKAVCVLPHDGVNTNAITGLKYEDHLRQAGFAVEVIKNQGKGAASMRIEAVRRLMPRMWFNADTTEHGRDALGYYHEKQDEVRGIGLGPEHDWASHAADAFGLMAVAYEEPSRKAGFSRKIVYPNQGII